MTVNPYAAPEKFQPKKIINEGAYEYLGHSITNRAIGIYVALIFGSLSALTAKDAKSSDGSMVLSGMLGVAALAFGAGFGGWAHTQVGRAREQVTWLEEYRAEQTQKQSAVPQK